MRYLLATALLFGGLAQTATARDRICRVSSDGGCTIDYYEGGGGHWLVWGCSNGSGGFSATVPSASMYCNA